jgi:hypothetical protein
VGYVQERRQEKRLTGSFRTHLSIWKNLFFPTKIPILVFQKPFFGLEGEKVPTPKRGPLLLYLLNYERISVENVCCICNTKNGLVL